MCSILYSWMHMAALFPTRKVNTQKYDNKLKTGQVILLVLRDFLFGPCKICLCPIFYSLNFKGTKSRFIMAICHFLFGMSVVSIKATDALRMGNYILLSQINFLVQWKKQEQFLYFFVSIRFLYGSMQNSFSVGN